MFDFDVEVSEELKNDPQIMELHEQLIDLKKGCFIDKRTNAFMAAGVTSHTLAHTMAESLVNDDTQIFDMCFVRFLSEFKRETADKYRKQYEASGTIPRKNEDPAVAVALRLAKEQASRNNFDPSEILKHYM